MVHSNGNKFELSSTPVDLSAFEKELQEYPDRQTAEELKNGFKNGFHINFEGPRKLVISKNLPSANKAPDIVRQKITKELEAGRVAGPFQTVPFTDFRVSPLGLVPKKQPGEYRLIHHLSYPEGDSINDYIDPEFCSVQYTRFDQAVKMIQKLGKGALLGKADIKNAFRLMIISPDDFPLLGFMFDGQYFFDRCLPFGLSYSCALWEKFAHFLHYAVRESCTVGELEHYLDDFLFGGEAGTTDCQEIMTSFFKTCGKMGVPVADGKTEGPQTIIIFLGFELDSILMEVRIPKDKIMKLQSLIEEILHKSSITLEVMQSLLGSLNFMCWAIVPGRPFCRRLINATRGITKPYHHIRISKAMRLDLQTWLTFFKSFNGVSVFHDRFWLSNADLCLFTDSSASYGKGFGAYFQGKWTYGLWPAEWFHRGITDDITVLELFPIFVALEIWGQHLSNKKILFKCDNQAVVHILNWQTSKAEYVMVLVRIITLKCLQLNVVLKAEHLSTSRNAVTDSLSRLQMNRFRQLAPEAEPEPEPVPDHLWSVFNQEPTSLWLQVCQLIPVMHMLLHWQTFQLLDLIMLSLCSGQYLKLIFMLILLIFSTMVMPHQQLPCTYLLLAFNIKLTIILITLPLLPFQKCLKATSVLEPILITVCQLCIILWLLFVKFWGISAFLRMKHFYLEQLTVWHFLVCSVLVSWYLHRHSNLINHCKYLMYYVPPKLGKIFYESASVRPNAIKQENHI